MNIHTHTHTYKQRIYYSYAFWSLFFGYIFIELYTNNYQSYIHL